VLHHPLFSAAHALPLLAAGLWAGQSGGRAGQALVVALVVGAALGIVAVKIGSAPPWRSAAVFGAMIAFGGLAAMRLRLPWPAAGALGLACGIWQGALGTVPPFQGGTGDWTATQTIVAAVLAPLVGYQLAMRARAMRAQWPRVVVRVAASWIAAAGILLLAFTLRL
jgi:urease accessory protein